MNNNIIRHVEVLFFFSIIGIPFQHAFCKFFCRYILYSTGSTEIITVIEIAYSVNILYSIIARYRNYFLHALIKKNNSRSVLLKNCCNNLWLLFFLCHLRLFWINIVFRINKWRRDKMIGIGFDHSMYNEILGKVINVFQIRS